uniref:Uncharacterized protein n=1 Tax=Raoultella ornithinolytica TaxID=54291 RepID=A0A4D6FXM6_RAOOR|nr:hypothetical protein [Raoultella ornithinolytica]UVN19778.1 hypothetical protein [Klebsiella michiganensis]
MARGWRKIPAAPGRSGKTARPVSDRTRDTGSGWQVHPPRRMAVADKSGA